MRAWRKKQRETGGKVDARVRDAEHQRDARAHAYVRAYIKRGRIVPPRRCDVCGSDRDEVAFYHPDPPLERRNPHDVAQRMRVQAQLRALLWLCPEHRRTVPASGQPVIPQWTWPGPIEPLPTAPRRSRFRIDPVHAAAGADALSRSNVSEAMRSIVFVDAMLRATGAPARKALLAVGLRHLSRGAASFAQWAPYCDAEIDTHVRAWVRDQLAAWQRERNRILSRPQETDEDRLAERQPLRPTRVTRSRVRGRGDVPTIGFVPAAPPAPPSRVPKSLEVQKQEEEALLRRVDERLAAVDADLEAIFARIDRAVTPRRKVEDDADQD
jgi:hypothetical protein